MYSISKQGSNISDGSQFTTCAAENPTLIFVTLEIRQADYIAKQMSEKAI